MNQPNDKMKLGHRIAACLIVVLAGVVLTSCVEPQPIQIQQVSKYFPCETLDTIQTPGKKRSLDQKVFVAQFEFGEERALVRETRVTFGKGGTPISVRCDFFFVLVGTENEMLARYGIWDPRVHIADDEKAKGFFIVRQADFVARFPFSPRAKRILVLDRSGALVNSADLIPAIEHFCKSQKADKDCLLFNKLKP